MPVVRAGRPRHFVSLGADPEFEIVYNGSVRSAENRTIDTPYGQIGRDGGGNMGSQMELRPRPANSPDELAENIRNLFRAWCKAYPNYGIGVKGDNYPIGSHIHFGFGSSPRFTTTADQDMVAFSMLLDYFLGRRIYGLNGEARGSYKMLSDDPSSRRTQAWGFEWRVLPSSIYIHPDFTKLAFRICFNLADKFWNRDGVTVRNTPSVARSTRRSFLEESESASLDEFLDNQVFPLNEDYARFLAYIKCYRQGEHNNILTAWLEEKELAGLVLPKPTTSKTEIEERFRPLNLGNNIILRFSDDWNSQICLRIVQSFQRSRWARKRPEPVRIVLYGLAQERGDAVISCSRNMASFVPSAETIGGLNYCDMPYPPRDNVDEIAIGCSRSFRVGDITLNRLDSLKFYLKTIKRLAEAASLHSSARYQYQTRVPIHPGNGLQLDGIPWETEDDTLRGSPEERGIRRWVANPSGRPRPGVPVQEQRVQPPVQTSPTPDEVERIVDQFRQALRQNLETGVVRRGRR